ncbi:MAG: hypothetical protein JWQ43_898 [Glaciihabitans sp.]|nr:hypothetical protein [Glaciihabitans sp.]
MKTSTSLQRGRLPLVAFLPVAILAVLSIAALFLPATDFFDSVRGFFVGALAVAAVATAVGMTTARRRARQAADLRALDNLEPLGAAGARAAARSDARSENGSEADK